MDIAHPDRPDPVTAAGWSFVGDGPLAGVRVPDCYVVEIVVDATGFRVAGRVAPPGMVARLITATRGRSSAPVALITVGTAPTGAAADLLFGSLADALGAPVIAADAAVSRTAHGGLGTSGAFHQWHPQATPGLRRGLIGRALPVEAAGQRRPTGDPSAPLPAVDRELLEPHRWNRSWTGPAIQPGPTPTWRPPDVAPTPMPVPLSARMSVPGSRFDSPTFAAPAGPMRPPANPTAYPAPQPAPQPAPHPALRPASQPAPPPRFSEPADPLWIAEIAWGSDERTRLRRLLNERFDAHARVASRTLAEEPGLRATGSPADLIADLVALIAYHTEERDAINTALRTGRGDGGREALVARGAAQALRRLPAVLGPVFAAGRDAPVVLSGYQAGAELVEPAFVDVVVSGSRATDATVEFVIWSVSARRLDKIGSDGGLTAVFPPGSRFAVLAVDPPTGDGAPTRVLLRDRAGERPGGSGGTDRVLDRLRDAQPPGEAPPDATGLARLLAFAPGLDERGHRFVQSPTDAVAGRQNAERGGARA